MLSVLVRQHSEAIEAWLLLASICGPLRRYQDVADSCGRVFAINPRQPVHTGSLARWRYYRSYLGPLLAEFGGDDNPLNSATS